MSAAVLAVFWLSVAAIAYAQFGYLACLAVLSRVIHRPVKRAPIHPSVSLIVPVYNGGGLISSKIENLLALDYPPELIEIIIVDDCSTDDTAGIVGVGLRPGPALHLLRLDRRSGKAAALNAGLAIAKGEIIGFTDVAAMLEPDALALAVERFADPTVGCVSSEDEVIAGRGVAASESLYTRIDTHIRGLEASIASATGMNGSFYLARHELCPPFPLDLATDMFTALHCVDRGFRAVVDERAKVRLTAQPNAGREFERKVRTMVTGLRAQRAFIRLLNPLCFGVFSIFLVSHKLLRYLTPVFVLSSVASTAYLSPSGAVFTWLLWAELALVCIGLLQIGVETLTARSGAGTAPAFICVTIAAAMMGWYRYFRGERYETWQPTERSPV